MSNHPCFLFLIKRHMLLLIIYDTINLPMNKKTKLLMISILSMGLCASMVFVFSDSVADLLSANKAKPDTLDCSYYFDNDEYTSLYDLNVSRLDGGSDLSNVTTWGTVTCSYYNNSNHSQIIQSTDKYGNASATCLYNVGQANIYPVGTVVSVTGKMTLYNGMSEMTDCSITKDYDSNPSPVEALEIDGLPTRTDPSFTDIRYMGTRLVHLSNVSLGEVNTSSRQCTATLDNGNQVTLFYNSISEKTDINNKIINIRTNNSKANVTGYVTCYSNNNTGTPSLQVLLRHADEIEEIIEEKTVDYLEVSTEKNFYYMDNITMDDFIATVHYTDGTSKVVSTAYITQNADTSSLGQKKLEFAYEYDGQIYDDTMWIMVNDTVASLEVLDPVIYYAFNESFITPTVYGRSYSYEPNLTSEVEFSGFDSYWESEYHSQIFVDYTNSAGRHLTESYTYYVSSVEALFTENAKTEFDLGEAFDYPTVYANFACASSVDVDVSDRVTFSGFDSSTPGDVEVHMSFGNYETSYYVEIIDTTPIDLYEYEVYISNIGSYTSGNYGQSGDFEYYRAVYESGYLIKLLDVDKQPDCEDLLEASLYNINPIKDIDHITFSYKTSDVSSSTSPKLYVGENSYDDVNIPINYSTSLTEVTIDLSTYNANYFKFSSGDTSLYLDEVTVYYSGLNTPNGSEFVYKTTGTNEYRIVPTVYSGDLVDGKSSIDVPVSYDVTHTTVLEYKTYTYYSYEYVSQHPEYVSAATITSPVDVCNYFQAFGCAPANFAAQNKVGTLRDGKTLPTKAEVNSLFGDDARCISKYTRDDGYAQYVPYYDTPLYYEFDINTNGEYSIYSRQSGRIVAWACGFTGSDYGNGDQVVCTYTDDHYATFKEYNNYGGFLSRFNVERKITGCIWGSPTTLSN